MTRCPCLSGLTYDDCCGRLHSGAGTAQTAEQLMRSRYSAFAVSDADYLRTTWHSSTRPADLALDADRESGGSGSASNGDLAAFQLRC